MHSWSIVGPSSTLLGLSWRQEAHENEKRQTSRSSDAPLGLHFRRIFSYVGDILGQVALQHRMGTTSCELVHRVWHLRRQLGPELDQLKLNLGQLSPT